MLGEITLKIGSGATPRGGKESYKNNGTPLIRSMNVHDLRFDPTELAYLDDEQAGQLDGVEVVEGDVLLNITGASVARSCYAPRSFLPARVNQHVAIIRPNRKYLDGKFLSYLLVSHTYKSQLLAIAQGGATREALTKGGMEQFPVVLPPLPTQRRIASILSAYDDLIENNTRRIAILEEMARRLYEEWFVQFRFPGHEEVTFQDSELGRIPDDWSVVPLREIVKLKSGYAFRRVDFRADGEHWLITIKNVQDGEFLPISDSRLATVPSNVPRHCFLDDGDMLLSLTGNVGRICVVYGGRYLLNQRVAKLVPKDDMHRPYVYSIFRSRQFRERLENLATGVAQQNLSPVKTEGYVTVHS